ncbi:TIGR02594 family protein [Prosthecomicrobium sp. N25]|uniref:TIGR02594 family protein n=1 Tax=Prosthecomicrobium sp. N25 TaxID=3129254 RepID=UPI003076E2CF
MSPLVPWHDRLSAELGLAEIPGPGSRPRILEMAAAVARSHPRLEWIAAFYEDDDIPWCGLAVAWAMVASGLTPPLPNPLSARAWAEWGRPLSTPVPGAVLVFARQGGGHVGLYEGEDKARYLVLGGNQGNRVGRDPVARSRLLADAAGRPIGIRWPATVPVPAGAGPVRLDLSAGAASRDER